MRQEVSAIEQWTPSGTGHGLHLMGEWFRCRGQPTLLYDAAKLRGACRSAIQDVGLTVAGELFGKLTSSGLMGTLLFTDSHLVIKTWPDERSATVDICFIVRSLRDRMRAYVVYTSLRGYLLPERENYLQINRSGHGDVPLISR